MRRGSPASGRYVVNLATVLVYQIKADMSSKTDKRLMFVPVAVLSSHGQHPHKVHDGYSVPGFARYAVDQHVAAFDLCQQMSLAVASDFLHIK